MEYHLGRGPEGNIPFYLAPTTRFVTDDLEILTADLEARYGAEPWRDEAGKSW